MSGGSGLARLRCPECGVTISGEEERFRKETPCPKCGRGVLFRKVDEVAAATSDTVVSDTVVVKETKAVSPLYIPEQALNSAGVGDKLVLSADKPETSAPKNETISVAQTEKTWNPLLAVVLSVVPGLGQIYNKQYLYALGWFVSVVVALVFSTVAGGILWLGAAIMAGVDKSEDW